MHAGADAEPLKARRRAVGERFEFRVRVRLPMKCRAGSGRSAAPTGRECFARGLARSRCPSGRPRDRTSTTAERSSGSLCFLALFFLARGKFGGRRRGGKSAPASGRQPSWIIAVNVPRTARRRTPCRRCALSERQRARWAQSVSIGATGCIAQYLRIKSSGVAAGFGRCRIPGHKGLTEDQAMADDKAPVCAIVESAPATVKLWPGAFRQAVMPSR